MDFGADRGEQTAADPLLLTGPEHIGVADEDDLPPVLAAHYPQEAAGLLPAPEFHSRGQFTLEFSCRHIRVMPAVVRYDSLVHLGPVVDNLIQFLEVSRCYWCYSLQRLKYP